VPKVWRDDAPVREPLASGSHGRDAPVWRAVTTRELIREFLDAIRGRPGQACRIDPSEVTHVVQHPPEPARCRPAMAGYGLQKLGANGGAGLRATNVCSERLGFSAPGFVALAVAVGELALGSLPSEVRR